MRPYLVLDVETQKCSWEVEGGWNNIADFGLAVAVTTTEKGKTEIWTEDNVKLLIARLHTAPLIVTFNGIRFDYEVLRPYGLEPELLEPKSYDILKEITRSLGHRLSLQNVATATLKVAKTGNGLKAVELWKEGKVMEVMQYCSDDVDITRRLYEFLQKHGELYYYGKTGAKLTCKLSS